MDFLDVCGPECPTPAASLLGRCDPEVQLRLQERQLDKGPGGRVELPSRERGRDDAAVQRRSADVRRRRVPLLSKEQIGNQPDLRHGRAAAVQGPSRHRDVRVHAQHDETPRRPWTGWSCWRP